MRDGWTETTLGDVAGLVIGRTPSRSEKKYWTDELTNPFCTIADMDGKWISPSREGVTNAAIQEGKARLVSAGSLMMSFKLTLGRVGFAGVDLYPNEAIVAIDVEPSRGSSDYLYLVLGFQDLSHGSGRAIKGATLNSKSLAAIPLNLPPLPEQKRIVDVVSSVDAYIDALQQQADTACRARNAVLHELLSAGGDDWTETTLGDVADASWGNTSVTKKQYKDSGFTAFSASGPDGYVDWFEHDGKGVVLSAIGALCGKTWLAEGKWTPIKNTIWIKSKQDECLNDYLYLVSKTPDVWPIRGQAQPFISLGDVRLVEVSLPPIEEQERIVEIVSSMDDVIHSTEQAVTDAKNLRSGLLSDLLSGEHEIPTSYDKFVGAA